MKSEIIRDPWEMQRFAVELKHAGKRIAVVPTMGALHAGHRALIRQARGRADVLVVSIFVNPSQFAPNEDLAKYPRTFDSDRQMCEEEGVDFIFAPTPEAMYPAGYSTYITVENLSGVLCGVTRPIHFRGVATIVTKLFLITQADVGVFGWKDAQQLLVIRRMAQDLNIPIEIEGVETVREPDGLAKSSRNKYLSPEDRADAVVLHRALENAREMIARQNVTDAALIRKSILDQIANESQGRPDYVEVVSMATLEPLQHIEPGNTLIALACYWGTTRLIDNLRV